jgi:hypothetical protein
MAAEQSPRFEHACDACVFLGRQGAEDVYFCLQGGAHPTLIFRSDSEGEEYRSGWHLLGELEPELRARLEETETGADRWYQVRASFTVRAKDENAAVDEISEALRRGYEGSHGVFPVGTFNAHSAPSPLRSPIAVDERVEHRDSGWSGVVTAVEEESGRVTVKPTHPRPKEVFDGGLSQFVPTPEDWDGWAPITVDADELVRL